jgi:predicted MFS family arabinose efflux permease
MAQPALTPRLTFLLAATAGMTVANIYYNQALLPKIADTFHVDSGAAGWVAVATQLGYASGLLLLVPLGDSVNRKTLLVLTSLGAAAAMVVLTFSVNLPMTVVVSYLLGTICITPQVAIPYGAGLARPEKRGRAVGAIMSGLLIGVLGARSFAGFLSDYVGWREVFAIGAGLTLLISLCLLRLPSSPVANPVPYRSILASLWPLLKRERLLRRHALLGALSFGAFSAFWTTLAFYLEARPEHYGGRMVGWFGLIAIVGVLVAPVVGRLADRLGPQLLNGVALATMALSFGLMSLSVFSLGWLVAGTILMDAGAQANQISNQTRIYTLPGELRNRITSVYMIIYFIGGTLGSLFGSYAWRSFGWNGVCALGVLLPVAGLLVLRFSPRPATAVAGAA